MKISELSLIMNSSYLEKGIQFSFILSSLLLCFFQTSCYGTMWGKTESLDQTESSTANSNATSLQGIPISPDSPNNNGQFLKFNGTQWFPSYINISDLKSSINNSSALAVSCNNNQAISYNSALDSFECVSISIQASQITQGTLAIENGGTGASTQSAAANNLLPSQASNAGKFLSTDGSNLSWSSVSTGTNQWITSGSNIYFQSGFVGIGTPSPNSLIEAYSTNNNLTAISVINTSGGGSAGAKFSASNSAGSSFHMGVTGSANTTTTSLGTPGSAFIYFTSIGENLNIVNDSTTGDIMFYTTAASSSPVMTIKSTRYVGFGTSSPTAPVQVAAVAVPVAGTKSLADFADTNGPAANNGGGITFSGYYDLSGILVPYAGIQSGKSNGTIGDNSAYLSFSTRANGVPPTEKLRIDSTGKVGIGTSFPAYQLDVRGASMQFANDGDIYQYIFSSGGALSGKPTLWFQSSRGTNASSTYPLSGDSLGAIFFGNQVAANIGAKIESIAVGNHGSGGLQPTGGKLEFSTTPSGTNNAAIRMTIDDIGNVGVGTIPGYKLDVNGDINLAGASSLLFAGSPICTNSGCSSPSDIKLKENIQPLEDSLSKVLNLRGVSFNWKDKKKFGAQSEIGFIAQDLEVIFPEVVKTNPRTGLKSVAYDHIVVPLVESLKELHFINKNLSSKIFELEKKNEELNKEYSAIKDRLDKVEKLIFKSNPSN